MAHAGLLDTESSYLADGEEVSTSLDDLDGDSVVHGLPACRIRSSAGQGLCPGLFCSMTTGGHIGYESLLELDRRWLADCDPQVEWIARSRCGCRGWTVRRAGGMSLTCCRRRGPGDAPLWVRSGSLDEDGQTREPNPRTVEWASSWLKRSPTARGPPELRRSDIRHPGRPAPRTRQSIGGGRVRHSLAGSGSNTRCAVASSAQVLRHGVLTMAGHPSRPEADG